MHAWNTSNLNFCLEVVSLLMLLVMSCFMKYYSVQMISFQPISDTCRLNIILQTVQFKPYGHDFYDVEMFDSDGVWLFNFCG